MRRLLVIEQMVHVGSILLILLGCWPKKFRAGMVLLLGCHLAAWCWYYGVAA